MTNQFDGACSDVLLLNPSQSSCPASYLSHFTFWSPASRLASLAQPHLISFYLMKIIIYFNSGYLLARFAHLKRKFRQTKQKHVLQTHRPAERKSGTSIIDQLSAGETLGKSVHLTREVVLSPGRFLTKALNSPEVCSISFVPKTPIRTPIVNGQSAAR